ncbi:MAG TPA: hypothetical protein VGW57_11820 [Chthoniobacterales bacterium]|nr:hypothetical protein [Chthoniobacterales bacterium]
MPISIYRDDDSRAEMAWLCDDDWDLPSQVVALRTWLTQSAPAVGTGPYIADIGFSVRANATAGGSALSPEMMRHMADLGITLFLSEYSALKEDREHSPPKA